MNLKVTRSNRWTARDAKTMLFRRSRKPLNFIVLVILAKFLIPEFGSYRVAKTLEVKFSGWNQSKIDQEQSLDC